jgi:hypothetical protein
VLKPQIGNYVEPVSPLFEKAHDFLKISAPVIEFNDDSRLVPEESHSSAKHFELCPFYVDLDEQSSRFERQSSALTVMVERHTFDRMRMTSNLVSVTNKIDGPGWRFVLTSL